MHMSISFLSQTQKYIKHIQGALLSLIGSYNIKYKKSKLPCYKESGIQSSQHQKEKIVFLRVSHICKSIVRYLVNKS